MIQDVRQTIIDWFTRVAASLTAAIGVMDINHWAALIGIIVTVISFIASQYRSNRREKRTDEYQARRLDLLERAIDEGAVIHPDIYKDDFERESG